MKGDVFVNLINFNKVIDEYLTLERERTYRERNIKVFYPSELTFPCLRCQYLRYMNPAVPFSPKTQRIFKIGSIIHDLLQEIFKEETCEFSIVDIETPIRRFYQVNGDIIQLRGRADARIEKDGEEYFVKIKTIKPQSYKDDPFKYLTEPKESHLKQLLWYLQSSHVLKGFRTLLIL